MRESQEAWRPGPPAADLGEQAVHVWRVDLDAPGNGPGSLCAVLSPDEAERARRCRLPRQRDRFVSARGALRQILSHYTGERPERLVIGRSGRGRPYLVPDPGRGLDFNLSHSGGIALVAVACGSRVGVDIEEIDPAVGHRAMARRFLTPGEAEAVHGLPDADGRRMFFTRWTWREALAKAVDRPIPRTLDGLRHWKVWDLTVRSDVCAALVTAPWMDAPDCWTWGAQPEAGHGT